MRTRDYCVGCFPMEASSSRNSRRKSLLEEYYDISWQGPLEPRLRFCNIAECLEGSRLLQAIVGSNLSL